MIDPYQVVEARALGADCILLIMACLDDQLAAELARLAHNCGMDVLVEVHDARRARARAEDRQRPDRRQQPQSQDTGGRPRHHRAARPKVPKDRVLVAESGLGSPADLARMAKVGASAFLIGESFMRKPDVEAAVREILAKAA